jgi:hypothetical protein
MNMLRRSRRRGMIIGAAAASSRANKRAAAAQSAPAQPVQEASAVPSTDDVIEQIKKLADLRDQGILTDAEFEAKKKQLLGL